MGGDAVPSPNTSPDTSPDTSGSDGHLACPFCESYDVDRLYLASLDLDTCECQGCGARWDEDRTSGAYRGRASEASVVTPRHTR